MAHPGPFTLTNPPAKAATIAISDVVDLPNMARAIFVGTAGDLTVTLRDMTPGTFVTYKNIPSGTRLSGFFTRVWAATTATDLIAEW